LRYLMREHLCREQPFEQVVVPDVAVVPGEADDTRHGVCLEHAANGVLPHPDQFFVGPVSRSKSSEDSGPSARMRASPRSASAAFSVRAAAWKRGPLRPMM